MTLTNAYDTIGRRTNVSDNLSPAGSTTFTYDAANRMTNVKLTVGGTLGPQVTFTYDAASRLTGLTRQDGNQMFPPPNKVLTTFTYDNTDRMLTITHTYVPGMGSSSTIATYTYAYNAASELTNETNQDGSFTYTYDNTSQLTGVDASGGTCGATGCDESFGYDVNGNRTMTGYSTGTGNRLTSDGTHNYTFDDNGNTLTKTRISDSQKWEYTWDYRNRLTQVVVKNSGGTILQQTDFTYDAFDRRIIKTYDPDGPGAQSATSTATIYDGASFAANAYIDYVDPDGPSGPQAFALDSRRLFGPAVDMILARRNASGTVAWYLTDHLGTVRDLVNTSGTVLDHISYSTYGKVTAETNPSNGDRFNFTAREYDSELAQYYYRARHYDPAAGRFFSEDPIQFDGRDANLFRYVVNGPVNRCDPTGLLAEGPTSQQDQLEQMKQERDAIKARIEEEQKKLNEIEEKIQREEEKRRIEKMKKDAIAALKSGPSTPPPTRPPAPPPKGLSGGPVIDWIADNIVGPILGPIIKPSSPSPPSNPPKPWKPGDPFIPVLIL